MDHSLALQLLSRVWLFATPWTVACQAPLSFSSPGDLPGPGIETASPALTAEFFTTEPPGKPNNTIAKLIRIFVFINEWQSLNATVWIWMLVPQFKLNSWCFGFLSGKARITALVAGRIKWTDTYECKNLLQWKLNASVKSRCFHAHSIKGNCCHCSKNGHERRTLRDSGHLQRLDTRRGHGLPSSHRTPNLVRLNRLVILTAFPK